MKIDAQVIIPEIAVNVGMKEKEVKDVIDGLAFAIKDHLTDGDEIAIKNLGVFGSKMTAEKDVILPHNGERIHTTPRLVPTFRASSCIKTALAAVSE